MLARHELHRLFILEQAGADFWALQIGQDPDRLGEAPEASRSRLIVSA
jgi:hypothetical protein